MMSNFRSTGDGKRKDQPEQAADATDAGLVTETDGVSPAAGSDAASDAAPVPSAGMESALGDVERHLQMLRSVQTQHAEREQRLLEREEALQEAAGHLEAGRNEIRQRNERLEAEQAKLDAEREEIAAARERINHERDRAAEAMTGDRERLEAGRRELDAARASLESDRQALESELEAAAASQSMATELDARQAELDARATELAARLEAAEAAEAAACADAESRASAIAEQAAALASRVAEVDAREAMLEQRSRELDAREADLTERLSDLDGQREVLETARQTLVAQTADLNADRDRFADARGQLESRVTELESERDALRDQVGQLEAAADEAAAAQSSATQDSTELSELRQEIAVARQQLAAAEEALGEARGESSRLTGELQAALERTSAELEARTSERDGALEDLAAAQAGGGVADAEAIDALQLRLALAESELAARIQEIETLTAAHTAAAEAAEIAHADAVESAESSGNGGVAAEAAAGRMRQLSDTIEALTAERDAAIAECDRVRAELADVQAAAAAAAAASSAGDAGGADAGAAEGAEDLAAARAELDAMKGKLKERASRISMIAQHLKRRKERLQKLRMMIDLRRETEDDRPTGPVLQPGQRIVDFEQHAAQLRHLEQQRMEVLDRRRELGRQEKKMIRRWAAPKAFGMVASAMLLAVAACGIAWGVADRIDPAVRSASVTLEARASLPGHETPEALQAWSDWHRDRVSDSEFRVELADRMVATRLDQWRKPEDLAARLDADLTTNGTADGHLTFTLAGTDGAELQAMLDVLATTLASESMNTFKGKPEAVWAGVRGEREEGGMIRYAGVNEVPIVDNRLQTAGPIAAGTYLGLLIVVFGIYTMLLRARREIDEDGTLFSDSTDLGMVESLRIAS
ncbi:MAG: hypothetical protein AB8G96_13535 [Phycisphaerales bacterium]